MSNMKISLSVLLAATTSLVSASEVMEPMFSETALCHWKKQTFCLSSEADSENQQGGLVLDKVKKRALRFDITLSDNYDTAYLLNPHHGSTKYCMNVNHDTTEEFPFHSIDLTEDASDADCEDYEDVLFELIEQEGNQFRLALLGQDLCLASVYESKGMTKVTHNRVTLHTKSRLALYPCSDEEYSYATFFKAHKYLSKNQELIDANSASVFSTVRTLSKSIQEPVSQPSQAPTTGTFCMTDRPDLCLGISLTDGTTLEAEKMVQVKNLTKNKEKGLKDLKLAWYWDQAANTISSAENYDYCIEAIYDVELGPTRAGTDYKDDILHLGYCNEEQNRKLKEIKQITDEPSSEIWRINESSDWAEVQTYSEEKGKYQCATVVECIKYEDKQNCALFKGGPVTRASALEQGAFVRLRDCDSKNLVSQRFFWTVDEELTNPPTRSPTPEAVTPAPTGFPTEDDSSTNAPTDHPVTAAPTPNPTAGQTNSPTSVPVEEDPAEEGEQPVERRTDSPGTGLIAGLSLIFLIALAIIIIAAAYYYKHRSELNAVPPAEEDENFIARV